jgi:hypothetical protein
MNADAISTGTALAGGAVATALLTTWACSKPEKASRKWYSRCPSTTPATVMPSTLVSVKSDKPNRPGSCS